MLVDIDALNPCKNPVITEAIIELEPFELNCFEQRGERRIVSSIRLPVSQTRPWLEAVGHLVTTTAPEKVNATRSIIFWGWAQKKIG